MILRPPPEENQQAMRAFPRVDVWWGGMRDNGALMLILSDQLCLSQRWRNATVTVKLMVPDQASVASAKQNLTQAIQQLRINARPEVLVKGDCTFPEILQKSSKDASLVILGMAIPEENFSQYYAELQRKTAKLPLTMFVLASQDLSFIDVLKQS